MPTLRDIQRRIRSVQSTQKITRAMKLVAAAKLRRAQERILAARPYAGKMKELLGNLSPAPEAPSIRCSSRARARGGRSGSSPLKKGGPGRLNPTCSRDPWDSVAPPI